MTRSRRLVRGGLLGCVVTLLVACADGSPGPVPTSALEPAPTVGVDAAHVEVDVVFAQSMLALHQQELELAVQALERSEDRAVRELSQAVVDDRSEAERLLGLLGAWGATVPGGMEGGGSSSDDSGEGGGEDGGEDGGEGDGAVAGPVLLGAAQVAGLATAPAEDFDAVLLTLLAQQHRNAVALADLELAEGSNPQAVALAAELRESHSEALTRVEELADR